MEREKSESYCNIWVLDSREILYEFYVYYAFCFQLKEKKEKAEKEMSQKKEAFKAGRTLGISGRELFEFNPELVQGDDEEAGDDDVITVRRNEVIVI